MSKEFLGSLSFPVVLKEVKLTTILNICIFAVKISSELPPHALSGGFFVVKSKSWKIHPG
jgi:hypothetical protein